MKETEILEGNQLIAEFMGAYIAHEGMRVYDMDGKFPNGKDRQTLSVMQYHSSWDWLMLIVDKIESKKVSLEINSQWNEFNEATYHRTVIYIEKGEMSKDRKCIYNSEKIYNHTSEANRNKIHSTYESVVDFIKWYNQNKES